MTEMLMEPYTEEEINKALKHMPPLKSPGPDGLRRLTPQRDLRQGDPLSSYLFIICLEVFSRILQDLQRCDKTKGIAISCSSPSISHLFFADDTLLPGCATTEEARHFHFAINLYEKVLGQLVNLYKSSIVFSRDVDQSTVVDIVHILGFKKVDSHRKYPGLPSIVGRNKKEIFGHIRDRIWHCIQGWSRHNFSKADKEILIKSMLEAICLRYELL
ncbi:hypothetical protein DH2020_012514 [Rehmannia glutinosa]|uniref:Reverse transcriptase domain-containing protein n=1 Tax=Rehmannia glutinosa TaxID=99300 RepID=A0ABR0X331_REHGL